MAHDGKNNISHVETRDEEDQIQKTDQNVKLDAFGASAKTDPKEIALVKKLDWYMMVSVHVFCQLKLI